MTITLRSPENLVASVPYMLGFHPRNSIVIVWLADNSIALTMRVDAEDGINDPDQMFAISKRVEADEAVILCYDGGKKRFADIAQRAAQQDWSLRDALYVENGKWISLVCNDPTCCGKMRVIDQVALDAAAAEFIAEGRGPLPSREDISAAFYTDVDALYPEALVNVDARFAKDQEATRDYYIQMGVDLVVENEGYLTELAIALRDIRVRDCLIWHLVRASREDRLTAYDLLVETSRSVPLAMAAPAATLAGLCAYLTGDGAKANIAMDFADTADPDYSLLLLLHMALSQALPPESWIASMSTVTYEECRGISHE